MLRRPTFASLTIAFYCGGIMLSCAAGRRRNPA
jgi:hypothetical protein